MYASVRCRMERSTLDGHSERTTQRTRDELARARGIKVVLCSSRELPRVLAQQVLSENNAMQVLGKGDVSALARKNALSRYGNRPSETRPWARFGVLRNKRTWHNALGVMYLSCKGLNAVLRCALLDVCIFYTIYNRVIASPPLTVKLKCQQLFTVANPNSPRHVFQYSYSYGLDQYYYYLLIVSLTDYSYLPFLSKNRPERGSASRSPL